ncbi:MAG: hypothetical protein E4H47_02320 [Parcubacteria group bacterium]|nr:MAG: hypothetical protein E4H47_02320 [Parcubacteria group bacterium]
MNNTIASSFPLSISPNKLGRIIFSKIFWTLTLSVTLSLVAACVFQLNARTREVYLLGQYQDQLNILTQENKVLEINFSKTNSLNSIGDLAQNQLFEKTDKIEYIRILETTALAK